MPAVHTQTALKVTSTSPPADVTWLLEAEAASWLEKLDEWQTLPVHQQISRLRKHLSAHKTHLLLEQLDLRKRAAAKFENADQMLFTKVGFEQATDQWIASYKAKRFDGFQTVADLCCGIGGDAVGLARVCKQIDVVDRAVDLIALATHNARVVLGADARSATFRCDDVKNLDLANYHAWHIDPDRRPAGRRTIRTELQEPTDEQIDQICIKQPNGAVKLAPGADAPDSWQGDGELEWISHLGECRQQVAWLGELAAEPGLRRATILKPRSAEQPISIVGRVCTPPYQRHLQQFLYEPDPAVLAADLVGHLAETHSLRTFASTSGYLTSDNLIEEPSVARFEVLDTLPMSVKQLTSYLQQRSIGRLEIKVRAADVRPEELRKQLKLHGDNQAVLLITRCDKKRLAIVGRRIPTTS